MTNQKKEYFTAIIPNVRILYPHFFTPGKTKLQNGTDGPPQYKCDWLVPVADMSCMEAAMDAASKEFAQVFGNLDQDAFQAALTNAYRRGDNPKPGKPVQPHEPGMLVFKARNNENHKPTVFNNEGQPLLDASQVYSGCFCHLDVTAGAGTTNNGTPYIKFYLNQVMKAADGERIGGGGANPNAFAGLMGGGQSAVNPFAPVPGAHLL